MSGCFRVPTACARGCWGSPRASRATPRGRREGTRPRSPESHPRPCAGLRRRGDATPGRHRGTGRRAEGVEQDAPRGARGVHALRVGGPGRRHGGRGPGRGRRQPRARLSRARKRLRKLTELELDGGAGGVGRTSRTDSTDSTDGTDRMNSRSGSRGTEGGLGQSGVQRPAAVGQSLGSRHQAARSTQEKKR